jgi:hypothetical protein
MISAAQPSTRSNPPPDQSRTWLVVFTCLLQTAALSQLPFLQENAAAKAALSVVELCVLAMLSWNLRKEPGLWRWLTIAVTFVVLRFLYAWLIGYLRYDSTLGGALQEGRFGLLIIIAPVAFVFFRASTGAHLARMALYLAAALVVADLLVTWFFVRTGYLSLAGRGATRYVLSVLPLVLVVWIRMMIAIRSGEAPSYRDLGMLVVAMLHIILFSTSRTEALVCASVMAQWIYVRAPHLRWPLLGAAAALAYVAILTIKPAGDTQIAGRDYRLALAYTRDAFPFGVGLVPEAVQKAQLGTAGTFFASDYGPILLVYRYGLVGIVIGFVVLSFWLRFLLRTLTLPGTFVVATAVLFYFMIVPLLDYGSLIGGFLLGAMAAVMAAVPRSEPTVRAPRASRGPRLQGARG